MGDIEELLAGFDTDEDGEPQAPPEPQAAEVKEQENSTIKQMRSALKRASKQIEELNAFKTRTIEESRKGALQAAGLNEDQIQVFTKAYDEVTPETIDSFRTKVLGFVPASDQEPASPQPQGFAPTAIGSPPPAKVFSREEWDALYRQDPVAAHKVLSEGRVQRAQVRTPGPEW